MSKNNPCLVPVLGATGSGKSTFLRRHLAELDPPRLLIWNPMQATTRYDYSTTASLVKLYRVTRAPRFACVFVPPTWDWKKMRKLFDVFCEIACDAGDLVLLVEELKHVTVPDPRFCPPNWRRATGDGRQFGLRVYGTSQRPVQVDKDFLSNATLIRTGRYALADDIATVAQNMCIERAEIAALRPLDWIEKDMTTGEKISGTLTF